MGRYQGHDRFSDDRVHAVNSRLVRFDQEMAADTETPPAVKRQLRAAFEDELRHAATLVEGRGARESDYLAMRALYLNRKAQRDAAGVFEYDNPTSGATYNKK